MPGRQRPMTNSLRERREQLGLSQGQLAAQVGTSRQTLCTIEACRTVPGTALALRLAVALGCRVEDVFHLPGAAQEVTAHVAGPALQAPQDSPLRVRLSVAGPRMVALPLTGPLAAAASLVSADGVVVGKPGKTAQVRLLTPLQRLADTLVVSGCDPALPLVAAHLHRAHPRFGLTWLPAGSLRALEWLRQGAAHVAGMHVRDRRTGQENVPLVRRKFGSAGVVVIGFATWEQGLIVAAGNPRGIREIGDLARPDITFLNREVGSGARALVDAALTLAGISPDQVTGYGREASTHLAVAQVVALGLVDCGVGIRAAARAYGLTFLPLQRERYDLVIPKALLNHPPVQAFLETAGGAAVRSDLEAVGDYDTSRLGTTLAVLP